LGVEHGGFSQTFFSFSLAMIVDELQFEESGKHIPHQDLEFMSGQSIINANRAVYFGHISAELEAKLREQAKATGKAPEDIAIAALQDGLCATEETSAIAPLDQWLPYFDAWVAEHESRNPRLDDSRESIYPDRW
jgi:hypothetical protein